jgi:hypothetical protein
MEFKDEYIVIAIDITCIKVPDRGLGDERDEWNIIKKRYLKIHVAVNVKTKEILSIKVTN